MNSVQESKHELEAAIRYAENAISSAKTTIESMEFRQQMAQKNYQEQTGREQALEMAVRSLKAEVAELKSERDKLRKEKEASSGPCGCQAYRDLEEKVGDLESEVNALEQPEREEALQREVSELRRDLTVKTSQAKAWKKEYDKLKEVNRDLEERADSLVATTQRLKRDEPTMPVIPKAVAIAIFREGVAYGVSSACDEIDNNDHIEINESEYCGDFEVSFSKYIDLSDLLDLDWMRNTVGDYNEASVIEALKNLCADKEFECRIHGVDDQEEKKND